MAPNSRTGHDRNGGTPPPHVPLRSLSEGDRVDSIYLLRKVDLKKTRSGGLYLNLQLGDKTGSINGKRWNADEETYTRIKKATFLRVAAVVDSYRGSLQLNIDHLKPIDGTDIPVRDFLPATTQDVGDLHRRIRAIVQSMTNPHLRKLIEAFLDDREFMKAFTRSPAAMGFHHACVGGLLEHVVSICEAVVRIADHYERLDRDLLIAGAFLHDVGKVQELSCGKGFEYTETGQLVGHIVLGILLLEKKVAQFPDFPAELLDLLRHLIVSHHGEYEWGSPRLPMTGEAIVLHALDNLDAKLWSYYNAVDDAGDEDLWTEYIGSFRRKMLIPERFQATGNGSAPQPTMDAPPRPTRRENRPAPNREASPGPRAEPPPQGNGNTPPSQPAESGSGRLPLFG